MEVIPRLYAHSKYTLYLRQLYHGCGYSTVCTVGRLWFTLYILQAVPLIFTLVIVQKDAMVDSLHHIDASTLIAEMESDQD